MKKDKQTTLTEVKEHYEDYPYPMRDPENERTQLLSICGEFLGEISHWVFKGKQNFDKDFRCLIAGGGTGDAAIFLGEQLKGTDAQIVYLDFSKASMEIAQKRAEIRGIKNITWIHDSILNIPNLDIGKFDYINCIGVLHHLASPSEGLEILKSILKEYGGMSLMIYGKYGRTGVYQIQEIMKLVNRGVKNRAEEIVNTKAILNSLPTTNWFMRGRELIGDHITFGDIGVYDLFLHKQDRAYSIAEMYEFVDNSGLNFVNFSNPMDRITLNPVNYITDQALLQKVQAMDERSRNAICEIIAGNLIKHSFYVSNKTDFVAQISDLDNIPYFYTVNGIPQMLFNHLEDQKIAAGSAISIDINTVFSGQIKISLVIGEYTKYILKHIIPETKSIREILDGVIEDLGTKVEDAILLKEIEQLVAPFITSGVLLLRDKNTDWYERLKQK